MAYSSSSEHAVKGKNAPNDTENIWYNTSLPNKSFQLIFASFNNGLSAFNITKSSSAGKLYFFF